MQFQHNDTQRSAAKRSLGAAGRPQQASAKARRASLRGVGYQAGAKALSPGGAGRSTLLSFDKMEAVWTAWVKDLAAAKGLPENDPAIMKAAGRQVKRQVGALNFRNWVNQGGGSVWIGPVTSHAPSPSRLAPSSPRGSVSIGPITVTSQAPTPAADLTPEGAYNRARAIVARYATAVQKINVAVGDMDREAHKLKMPEGVQGVEARLGLGAMGLMYGVGTNMVRYAEEKVNLVGKGVEKLVGVYRPQRTINAEAKELGETAGTSIDLLTGRLGALYQQTRPAYKAFERAYSRFQDAQSAFEQADDYAWMASFGAMETALKSITATAKAYKERCDALGIPEQAVKIDKFSAAIGEGITSLVEISVGMLGGLAEGGEAPESGLKAVVSHAADKAKEAVPGAVAKRAAGMKRPTK